MAGFADRSFENRQRFVGHPGNALFRNFASADRTVGIAQRFQQNHRQIRENKTKRNAAVVGFVPRHIHRRLSAQFGHRRIDEKSRRRTQDIARENRLSYEFDGRNLFIAYSDFDVGGVLFRPHRESKSFGRRKRDGGLHKNDPVSILPHDCDHRFPARRIADHARHRSDEKARSERGKRYRFGYGDFAGGR